MKILATITLLIFIMTNGTTQNFKTIDEAEGLNVGINAPLFSAIDADSNNFVLADALNETPVVIVFYRGFWCPVCNKHLSQIQDSFKMILDVGATVVAISPEKPEYLNRMAKSTGAEFRLLYDEDYKIADAYDVNFLPPSSQTFMYNTMLGANLKETHSDDSQRLPIPATYIVGQDGKIVWRQFNPDYKKRSSVKDIIENLPK